MADEKAQEQQQNAAPANNDAVEKNNENPSPASSEEAKTPKQVIGEWLTSL